jgi:hypothetical protein
MTSRVGYVTSPLIVAKIYSNHSNQTRQKGWLRVYMYEHFLIQLLFMARKKQAILDRATRAPSSLESEQDIVRMTVTRSWPPGPGPGELDILISLISSLNV